MIRDFFHDHRRAISVAAIGVALSFTAIYALRPEFAGLFALIGAWAVPGIYVAATHWEAIESWGGRLISIFGFLHASIERVGVSAAMQGQINGARHTLEGEIEGALPHPVRLKFVRSAQEAATLSEGEIVIALGNHKARSENMARSTLAYTSADLIRPARPYVERNVMRSLDLSITKRLLSAADVSALDYFVQTIWPSAIEDEPRLRLLCHKIETIERQGLLTRVLLAEFLDLGRRLYPEFASEEVLRATADFVDYVNRVVTKRRDEELGEALIFRAGRLRVGIVLVADKDLAQRKGANPYVWRCLSDIKAGCSAVYLLARGKHGALVEDVLRGLEGNGRVLVAEGPSTYSVETTDGPISVTVARISCDQRQYRATAPEGEMAAVS